MLNQTHMQKVNLMARFKHPATLPDQDLDDIEKALDLDIWTLNIEKWRKVKINSRRIFDI